MSIFATQVQKFKVHVGELSQNVHNAAADMVLVSIKDGSPITGAPGQPVDRGTLRDSWTRTDKDKDTAVIATDAAYAAVIEDNLNLNSGRGFFFKNHGSHSVKLTITGWLKIVEQAVAQAK